MAIEEALLTMFPSPVVTQSMKKVKEMELFVMMFRSAVPQDTSLQKTKGMETLSMSFWSLATQSQKKLKPMQTHVIIAFRSPVTQ
jgi:hypothetical protein